MYILYIIPALFAASLGGLTYVVGQALRSGADVYSGTYSADTAKGFEDVFLFIPPKRVAEAGWAAAAVSFILVFLMTANLTSTTGVLAGLLLASLTGTLALNTPRLLLKVLKNRRRTRFDLQLVDSLVGMSNALKAGFSITQAFEAVVKNGENPIAQEFDVFLQQTRVGMSFSDALASLEQRVDSRDLTLVVNAIDTARKTGGNLTEILEKISTTIRERMRIENRIRTMTAQGRLQGIVVGAMPIVIGIAMMVVDPETMLPFLHSVTGIVVIVVVAILITCGGLIIRKIVNIDV